MTPPEGSVTARFEHATFSARDFSAEALVEAKSDAGVSVSVVLPARNEAATIGGVIDACQVLAGTLVDEVVVIDGDSTDGTATIAANGGAEVYDRHALVPEAGEALGKGDALWRSLTVTKGDIVVFCDTDVRNPSPEFVVGLLGPLLTRPGVELVKAFYDRPVQRGTATYANAGGRVTELTARPLLNLFWPELAWLVQPLSGECAARRELLEALPFFTGYGVEIGLLIDTLALRGVEVIAQVDLTERLHRNQDMAALSRMSYGILQVAARRLVHDGRLDLGGAELPSEYLQFSRDGVAVMPSLEHVNVAERPPMATFREAGGAAGDAGRVPGRTRELVNRTRDDERPRTA